jgi:hypothetical protein
MTNRINDQQLVNLLVEEGQTQAQAARVLGVTPAAISKRVKILGLDLRRPSPALAHIETAAGASFDAIGRLRQIDSILQEELQWLRDQGSQSNDARRATLEKLLGVLAELRKTIGTYIDLGRATAAIAEIAMFREIVLEVLNEADPRLREEVTRRLSERRGSSGRLVGALG